MEAAVSKRLRPDRSGVLVRVIPYIWKGKQGGLPWTLIVNV